MEIILWLAVLSIIAMVSFYLVSPFLIGLFFFIEFIAEAFGKAKDGRKD